MSQSETDAMWDACDAISHRKWATRSSPSTEIADLKRKLAEAEAREERLREALRDAIECVVDWSGYASDYFKDKHNLSGDLEHLLAALSGKEAANG